MQTIARIGWGRSTRAAVGSVIFLAGIALLCAQSGSAFTDGPLGRLADFIVANGKPTVLNAPVAEAMGLGGTTIPVVGQAFKPPGDDHLHIVLVSAREGRTDIVLTHTTMDQVGPMWLTSPSGVLRRTIYEDSKGVAIVKDGRFDSDFEAQKAYFLSKVPGG